MMNKTIDIEIKGDMIFCGELFCDLPENDDERHEFMMGVKFILRALEQPYEITRTKTPETLICGHCMGCGEGMYENTACIYCKGRGEITYED